MRLSVEWVSYCNRKLSPTELKYFLALSAIGVADKVTPLQVSVAVGNAGSNRKEFGFTYAAKQYIEALYHKQFVNFRFIYGGIAIDWVRESQEDERPPHGGFHEVYTFRNRQTEEIQRVERGSMALFCQEQLLERSGMSRLITGKLAQYRGWERVS